MTNWVRCNEGEEKHVKNSSIYGRFGLTRNGGGGDDRDVRTTQSPQSRTTADEPVWTRTLESECVSDT